MALRKLFRVRSTRLVQIHRPFPAVPSDFLGCISSNRTSPSHCLGRGSLTRWGLLPGGIREAEIRAARPSRSELAQRFVNQTIIDTHDLVDYISVSKKNKSYIVGSASVDSYLFKIVTLICIYLKCASTSVLRSLCLPRLLESLRKRARLACPRTSSSVAHGPHGQHGRMHLRPIYV